MPAADHPPTTTTTTTTSSGASSFDASFDEDDAVMRARATPCATIMRISAALGAIGGGMSGPLLTRLMHGFSNTPAQRRRTMVLGAVVGAMVVPYITFHISPNCSEINRRAYDWNRRIF
ncbi:hypothetical protein CAOG_03857 [Capsaspora owczarzaki ATCC 30864]|uniref:DUF7875 domain-containing protein n=1 Tax=Capsaspora owczarzaki (strain ATCC 30864) TaxID=595528 RepID=A0A0D2WNY9_CAPO3|nr:hypothetical protein CAOG_03857 [Capsaspora owczarzaki ATCC 30864]KJE92990.1 hypothetical protein CAOG_003857 [Capsaspora owczarzaki ATCC 30864]|eukprot:XP_004363585.1 hypothetical protein CAOG_03857 [Capsaspora owczarzaki ATCC 30864]